MHRFTSKTEEELYSRYCEQNKNLDLTEEETQRLVCLNKELLAMEMKLKEMVLRVKDKFEVLKTQNLPFLERYNIFGRIEFEKELPENFFTTEGIIWSKLAYQTSSDYWKIKYDINKGDFTQYSNFLLDNNDYMDLYLPFEFKLCSFLNNFIHCNQTLSYRDLLECSIDDFYPVIWISNYGNEVFDTINNQYELAENPQLNLLAERKLNLDAKFDWSKENIDKILKINEALWQLSEKLKSDVTQVFNCFKNLSKTDPLFNQFTIKPYIKYENKATQTPYADSKLLKVLQHYTQPEHAVLECDEDSTEVTIPQDTPWTTGTLQQHLSREQQNIRIHYLIDEYFIEGETYSLQDLVNIDPKDFVIKWRITFLDPALSL